MGYTNSDLVKVVLLSPNKTNGRKYDDGKTYALDTITIHCFVGQVTAQRGANVFYSASRQASCQYVVGTDGNALVCEEKNRSWCTGGTYKNNGETGRKNDYRACTFEVACDSTAPYKVRDDVMARLIELVADVCKRNNIPKLVWSNSKNDRINHLNGSNMTVHRDYDARSCPGDYLYNKMGYIAEEVNKRLGSVEPVPTPAPTPFEPYKVKITCDVLNVRKQPSTNSAIVTTVHKGEVYTIVGEQDGWGKLKSGAGWIFLKYTKKV